MKCDLKLTNLIYFLGYRSCWGPRTSSGWGCTEKDRFSTTATTAQKGKQKETKDQGWIEFTAQNLHWRPNSIGKFFRLRIKLAA